MQYLGDYKEDETVYFLWSTNDADGASVTRTADGTVSVYKDNGVSQSVAGVTDTEDFDSLTGIHACTIDLSADVFYATGADYAVVLSAATIDGQTVNAVLAHFSIENRFQEVDAVKISGSSTAADNVESVFLGTGHTDDVDLSARKLKLDCDTNVALEVLSSDDSAIKAVSSAATKHGMELAGNTTGAGLRASSGTSPNAAGIYADGTTYGIYAEGEYDIDADIHGTIDTVRDVINAVTATDVDNVKAVTDKLDDTLEDDGGTYRFTENALEEAPSGSGATAQQVWEYGTRALTDKAGFELAADQAVNVTKIGGDAQSATDLKDLADTGYDPSTHKVQGVVLTDTCTTNTDVRGTDDAATEAKQDIIDANLDLALADTDELQTNQGNWATATGFATGIKKNTALSNFHFVMYLLDGNTAATGKTITAERLIDDGTYSACANSPVEESDGTYRIDLAASDLNGDVITFKFTEEDCRTTILTVVTN